MTGVSEMDLAVGYDQIVKVLQDYVPPIQYELTADATGKWHGTIRSADGLSGEGIADTKALALKLGHNHWLMARVKALDQMGAAAVAEALIRADSAALEGLDTTAGEDAPAPPDEAPLVSAATPSAARPPSMGKRGGQPRRALGKASGKKAK